MADQRGRYYLGRVIKGGLLDNSRFKEALKTPVTITKQSYSWTIRDFKEYHPENNDISFYFGYLTKFQTEGTVPMLDREHYRQIEQIEPNMIIASSPFVYIPKYSGIAYLHVWNQIPEEVFVRRFIEIVKEKNDGFFVECLIEPITDLRIFYKKISKLSSIERIKATIHPPNPMFGILWKKLKEYLEQRNLTQMKIDEKSDRDKQIRNDLKQLINIIIEQKNIPKDKEIKMGDAAILMASDGYGNGHVTGVEDGKTVVINTSQNKLSILFSKEPIPDELKNNVSEIFDKIKEERHMDH